VYQVLYKYLSIFNTSSGRKTGDYKNNNYFKHRIYLNKVFELVIVGFIMTPFSAALYSS
jgi:hypothetical protein